MKPVSYESMPSTVNAGYPNVAVEHPLSTPKVMYCEKCGFASMNAVEFNKHMVEHTGARFFCFYCNRVSFSEAELNEHMKQHTTKYPFKCPHCGQGYMRRLCLVKHIDRLHSKNVSQGAAKPGMTKSPLVPVSTALTSASTADPCPPQPVVRVTVPTPTAPAVRLGKDNQRGKTLDTNVSNATNGNAERLSHLNGLIQHNRALTVSLPDEVSIPAGCLVELVEVKTVNGTKELKLRLTSQQENESVIKNTKTAVTQNAAQVKPLPSTLHHANTARSSSMDMCIVNRKLCETKTANVERPAAVPVKISNNLPNLANKGKRALKRTSPEIINLECNTVAPNKVFKNILSPVSEGNGVIHVTQAASVNHSAASPAAFSGSVRSWLNTAAHPLSMGTNIPQRAMDERKNAAAEPPRTIPVRRPTEMSNVKEVSGSMKLEPDLICVKSIAAPKDAKGVVCLNQQTKQSFTGSSLKGVANSAAQVRPPSILIKKPNVANQTFQPLRILTKPISIKAPVLPNHTNSKVSTGAACTQGVRFNEGKTKVDVSKPESFPVISSVFSLSQQPEESQGSIQPLVMALRGIVMDKKHSSEASTRDQLKIKIKNDTAQRCKAPAARHSVQVPAKNGSFTHDASLTRQTSEAVKVEVQDVLPSSVPTHDDLRVKEEKSVVETTDGNNCSPVAASKSSTCMESEAAPQLEAAATVDPLPQTGINENDVSKFLTISLRRVQVGVWEKSEKGLELGYKPRLPIGSLGDCTVIYPMPLKEDQLVKRPGPNQPVVVLNHPKPRVALQRASADSFADVGTPETVPKCQILKMRLSKVMGQKYEVMGCTVGVFP
ncbi:uncharacterized protein LOC119408663 [Nematolebias whitei]|uniref:uncharacterized protein LOC119408663 n=1 Tax=Nematolebias whitei TaxID=451745 RepID=UPI00189909F8|nr:uncharacterized protein LOC119408663 [Nematolebias whitei]